MKAARIVVIGALLTLGTTGCGAVHQLVQWRESLPTSKDVHLTLESDPVRAAIAGLELISFLVQWGQAEVPVVCAREMEKRCKDLERGDGVKLIEFLPHYSPIDVGGVTYPHHLEALTLREKN